MENPFPPARIKDSLKNAVSLDQKATSIRISIWKKLKKTVSFSRNKIFLKYWPHSNFNNGFQKNVNEKILFLVKRKSIATGCNKGFPIDGKTTSNRRNIWDVGTNWFPLARKCVSTS